MVRLFGKEHKDDNDSQPAAQASAAVEGKQEEPVMVEVREVEINLTLINQKLNYLIQQVEALQTKE